MYSRLETDINTNAMIKEQYKEYLKTHWNSLYGQAIYVDTDSIYTKENSMRKEFIVLHEEELEGSTMIVRKSAIISVSTEKFGADTFCYVRTENCSFRVTESYAEVVKRLFE